MPPASARRRTAQECPRCVLAALNHPCQGRLSEGQDLRALLIVDDELAVGVEHRKASSGPAVPRSAANAGAVAGAWSASWPCEERT